MAFRTYNSIPEFFDYKFDEDSRADEIYLMANHPSFGYTPYENLNLMPTSEELADLFDIFDIA